MTCPSLATSLRFIAASTMTAALFVSAHAAPPIQQNDDVLGQWRITKMLDASHVTALDDEQSMRLIGKNFIVEPDKVSLDGEVCDKPDFGRHYEDTVRYVREEAHASSWKLGLPTTVAVVDLACTEALIKGHDKIVILWKGVFFDAVRQGSFMPNSRAPVSTRP